MQLPTQKQFVDNCLAKYWFTEIPDDQKWEDAHFPLPSWSGEDDTVMLWSADHTVQGLLQSVELDHKCFHEYRTESDTFNLTQYYPEYLPLFEQLKSEFSSRAGKEGGKKSAAINKANSTGAFAPGVQSRGGRTSGKKAVINKTGIHAPGMQSAAGKKSAAQRYQCLKTKHISTAAGLANYQRARGIDTKLRVKIK